MNSNKLRNSLQRAAFLSKLSNDHSTVFANGPFSRYIGVLSIAVIILLSGCVARKDTILPIRSDREMLISMYKACVTQATTNTYNDQYSPEQIVQSSIASCRGQRNGMLRDYPQSWRTSMLKQIDEELFKSEIEWVLSKRN